MIVELPRACKGSEILDAFRQAADLERPGVDKWIPKEIEGRTEFDAATMRCVVERGINAIRHKLIRYRKYIFWGEEIVEWVEDRKECANLPAIRLETIREDLDYNFVDIDISVYIRSGCNVAEGWYDASRTSFFDWELNNYLPVFEMIVAKMIGILKKESEFKNELASVDASKIKKEPPPLMILPSRANEDPYSD